MSQPCGCITQHTQSLTVPLPRAAKATTALHLRRLEPPLALTFKIRYGLLVDFSLPRTTGCDGPPPLISKHILSTLRITPIIFGLRLMATQTLLVAGAKAVPAVFPWIRLLLDVGFGGEADAFLGRALGALKRLRRST